MMRYHFQLWRSRWSNSFPYSTFTLCLATVRQWPAICSCIAQCWMMTSDWFIAHETRLWQTCLSRWNHQNAAGVTWKLSNHCYLQEPWAAICYKIAKPSWCSSWYHWTAFAYHDVWILFKQPATINQQKELLLSSTRLDFLCLRSWKRTSRLD